MISPRQNDLGRVPDRICHRALCGRSGLPPAVDVTKIPNVRRLSNEFAQAAQAAAGRGLLQQVPGGIGQ